MGEKAAALPKLEVEGIVFPPVVNPPASAKTLFLGGAGVRGLEIGGRFIAFTAIGVYLEDEAVRSLSGKWSGKRADELADSIDFFRDIFAGPFEKFTRVTMILPLTGQQYSEKVAENCLAQWKAAGIYTEAEGVAIEKFKEAFQAESFGHGSSILFTHSPSGSLTIAFSKDGSVPEAGGVVIENRALCEALLESIIGERGVSPAAKRSLAVRVSELLKESQIIEEKVGNPLNYRAAALPKLEVEGIVFPPAVSPPGSAKTLFLGGAGSRGLDIGGRFITFTAIGVYLEDEAVRSLSGRWRGKNADELAASLDFFRDILTGPFEKFTRVTMIQPLTGQQYSEKVAENCLAAWKAAGIYTEAEGTAIEKFREAFKAESFGPGSSILFTHFPSGSLTITFSKDGSVPEAGGVVIENRALCEAVLESIIGKHGVSPAAKRSLAVRVSELLKESQDAQEKAGIPVAVSA